MRYWVPVSITCCSAYPADAVESLVLMHLGMHCAGVSSSPQQGGSLTAPSVGAGLLLGQENGQQTQPLSHSQQLQLLAANGMGNMGNRVYSGNLGTDKYADNGQYSDYGGGLHGAGGLSPSNLGGLAALGNTYGGGKLQQGLPTNGLPNNGYGGNQPSQDYSGLHMNGGAAGGIHNGLGNAALAHKLAGLPNGGGAGYSNGHHLGNGSLAGLGPGSGMTGSNGHLSGLHPGGMAGGYGLQQQQQHQQQQQQQMLNEQLQALGPAGIAQLPPQLQAYARELLLRQHRAALMGAQQMQQPPPPPFGMPGAGGMLPGAQRLDMAGFRRDLQRNDMPLGRQGSRPLPPKVSPASTQQDMCISRSSGMHEAAMSLAAVAYRYRSAELGRTYFSSSWNLPAL